MLCLYMIDCDISHQLGEKVDVIIYKSTPLNFVRTWIQIKQYLHN